MKHLIEHINKAFDNRIRLGIMSVLVVNDALDFNHIKDLLGITDGNLASHAKSLEKLEYIEITKQFIGKKPNTTYKATELGKKAFQEHIEALEKIIKSSQ